MKEVRVYRQSNGCLAYLNASGSLVPYEDRLRARPILNILRGEDAHYATVPPCPSDKLVLTVRLK